MIRSLFFGEEGRHSFCGVDVEVGGHLARRYMEDNPWRERFVLVMQQVCLRSCVHEVGHVGMIRYFTGERPRVWIKSIDEHLEEGHLPQEAWKPNGVTLWLPPRSLAKWKLSVIYLTGPLLETAFSACQVAVALHGGQQVLESSSPLVVLVIPLLVSNFQSGVEGIKNNILWALDFQSRNSDFAVIEERSGKRSALLGRALVVGSAVWSMYKVFKSFSK